MGPGVKRIVPRVCSACRKSRLKGQPLFNMEVTNKNQGPESPADLQWSQGAKNPRIENVRHEKNVGMLSSKPSYDIKDNVGTSKDDICIATNVRDETPEGDIITNPQSRITGNIGKKLRPVKKKNKSSSDVAVTKDPLGRKRVKKKLVRAFKNGKIPLDKAKNYGVSGITLCHILQPKNKWYKIKLMAVKHIYNKVMADPLLVAILCGNNKAGHVTRKRTNMIIAKLTENILKCTKFIPKFNGFNLEDGILLVSCYDLQSVTWLKSQCFYNLWEGGTTYVLNCHNFQCPTIYTAIFPDLPEMASKKILNVLSKQNPGLDLLRFSVRNKKKHRDHTGLSVSFDIDASSISQLKAVNMNLYFGLNKITLCRDKLLNQQTQKKALDRSLKPNRHKFNSNKNQNASTVASELESFRLSRSIPKPSGRNDQMYSQYSPHAQRYIKEYQQLWKDQIVSRNVPQFQKSSHNFQQRQIAPANLLSGGNNDRYFSNFLDSLKEIISQPATSTSQTNTGPFNIFNTAHTQNNLGGFEISAYMSSQLSTPAYTNQNLFEEYGATTTDDSFNRSRQYHNYSAPSTFQQVAHTGTSIQSWRPRSSQNQQSRERTSNRRDFTRHSKQEDLRESKERSFSFNPPQNEPPNTANFRNMNLRFTPPSHTHSSASIDTNPDDWSTAAERFLETRRMNRSSNLSLEYASKQFSEPVKRKRSRDDDYMMRHNFTRSTTESNNTSGEYCDTKRSRTESGIPDHNQPSGLQAFRRNEAENFFELGRRQSQTPCFDSGRSSFSNRPSGRSARTYQNTFHH